MTQPQSSVDQLRVALTGSGFSGTITCAFAAADVTNRLVFATLTITVAAVAPTTTTIDPAVTSAAINAPRTFTATVFGSSAGTPTGTVTFLLDGAQFGAPVPVSPTGQASTVIIAGGGIHSVVARYDGSAAYAGSSSSSATVGIPCDTVISGRHGTVSAAGRTICVRDAVITGTIVVPAGAVLDIENSTISGPVMLNALGGVRMCGSSVGNAAVAGSRGFVLIGDPAHGCAGNAVSGTLVVVGNAQGVAVFGNQISGSFQQAGNSGVSPLTGH